MTNQKYRPIDVLNRYYKDEKEYTRESMRVVAVGEEVLQAYCDCRDYISGERNLNFFCTRSVTPKEATIIMRLAMEGYNEFRPITLNYLNETCGPNTKVFLAREGSVSVYFKPEWSLDIEHFESNKDRLNPDEFSYDASLGMFRLWWD